MVGVQSDEGRGPNEAGRGQAQILEDFKVFIPKVMRTIERFKQGYDMVGFVFK